MISIEEKLLKIAEMLFAKSQKNDILKIKNKISKIDKNKTSTNLKPTL